MKQYKKLPRLYVEEESLAVEAAILLEDSQAHYVRNVMRLEVGDDIRIFNGQDGEFKAEIESVHKNRVIVRAVKKIVDQTPAPDIRVLAAPLKKEPMRYMIQKVTELGMVKFTPVICEHSMVRKINESRLHAAAVEAAEQCERLDVPDILPLETLEDVLQGWPKDRLLLVCLERSYDAPIFSVLGNLTPGRPPAILVGPEGGFSDKEIEMMAQKPFIRSVSLGPRILRAETAVVAALSCVQAVCGDWN